MPPAKKNSSRKSSSNAAAAATTNRRKSRAQPPSEDVVTEAEVAGLEASVPEEEVNGNEDSNDQENSDEDMEEEENDDDDEEMEDDDDDDNDEEMEEEDDDEMNHEISETPTSQKKKDMFLRSGKRKRRRSKETSGLTPPETLKKSTNKRARRSTAAAAAAAATATAKKQKKQESSATTATARSSKRQNRGTTMNGDSSAAVDTNTKPAAAPAAAKGRSSQVDEPESPVAGATTGLDPRRISYSQTAVGMAAVSSTTTTTRKQAPSTSNEEEEEARQENDVEIDEDMILNRPRNDEQNIAEPRPPARRRSAGEYISEFTEAVVAVVAGGNVFAAAASSRRTTTTTGPAAAEGTTTEQQQLEKTVERVVAGETQEEAAETIGQESVPSKLVRRLEPHATNLFRLTFMTILALSFWVVWPRLANIAELVVPLDKSLADPSEPASPTFEVETTIAHDSIVAEDDDDDDDSEIVIVDPPSDVIDAWNSDFLKEWTQVNEANAQFDASNEKILDTYNDWISIVDKITDSIEKRQTDARDRLKQLNRFSSLLLRHNQGGKLSREEMARIQVSSMELVGTPVFLTAQVDLWEIPDIDDVCTTDVDDENDEDAVISDDENGLEVDVNSDGAPKAVDLDQVKKRVSDLSLRAKMTAEKLISGDVAKKTVRRWVEDRLSDGLYSDPFVARTLDELESVHTQLDDSSPSSSHVATIGGGLFATSMYQVESAIQELLEMDRADKTGQFDHAAVSNGASVVYGGKRGTSKSLIDDLPLGNRLLRHINLRSYGFGPEAALTPTYPSNTLGQCWSFRQLTLDEQLNERDGFRMYEDEKSVQIPDDFKRGSLGTLTVRFAEPLYVSSFVIEYPAKKSSDEDQSSAARSFRLVGYEDAEATTKAWNLGSYTYDMKANIGQGTYLQEFEVPTSHGGHDIPMIRSISLAIDSNMGGDYTCLYRFRIHGDYE